MVKRKTRIYRVKIKDTICVAQVPDGTSLHPADILKVGDILAIKRGLQPYEYLDGTKVGKASGGWNTVPTFNTEDEVAHPWDALALDAVNRTKEKARVAAEHPELLPKIVVTSFKGVEIQKDLTTPRYFIKSCVHCANCKEPIYGTQTLHINKHGKVGSMDAFVPYNAIKCKVESNKWVHPACAAKSIAHQEAEDDEDRIDPFVIQQPDGKIDPTISGLTTEHGEDTKLDIPAITLLDILGNLDKYSADFARGAAYMYHLMTHKETKS